MRLRRREYGDGCIDNVSEQMWTICSTKPANVAASNIGTTNGLNGTGEAKQYT